MKMVKYKIIIDRTECIQCGTCYDMDPTHFDADEDYTAMVVDGETDETTSEGTFEDEEIKNAKEAAEECPVDVITVEEL